ncbi:SDR family oxidoreductase [Microbacterium sp. A588]
MRIAVAGGTGQVGAHVVEVARLRGHDVVVLARSVGVDLVTGSGAADAMRGVDVVIDVAATTTMNKSTATAFFEATTRTLFAAEQAAGVGHHIALSIVGIDGVDAGYYGAKLAHERAVMAGAIPWTILRATQFHEFAGQVYERGAFGPFHVALRMRTQPIAAREVAERLVNLAEGAPTGRATDLAGPREEQLVDMVRAYARSQGAPGWIPAMSLPGEWGRAMRDGSALPSVHADLGQQTFAEWLDAR